MLKVLSPTFKKKKEVEEEGIDWRSGRRTEIVIWNRVLG